MPMNEPPAKVIRGLSIDPAIFSFPFSCRCNGDCCRASEACAVAPAGKGGVFMDLKQGQEIAAAKESIIALMDDTQSKDMSRWFEPARPEEEFASGIAIGADAFNGKCAFLDGNGLCVLQRLAIEQCVHHWRYKPAACVLFPLTISRGILTIDYPHIARVRACNAHPMPETSIYEACCEELHHLLGDEAFAELEDYSKTWLAAVAPPRQDAERKPNDISQFARKLAQLAERHELVVESLGEVGGYSIPLVTARRPVRGPRLLVAAGFHGEEPGGPWGVIRFLDRVSAKFLSQVNLSFLPLVNPTGFCRGRRENDWGEDPNRGFCAAGSGPAKAIT